jgi:hypothetical protein
VIVLRFRDAGESAVTLEVFTLAVVPDHDVVERQTVYNGRHIDVAACD